MHPTQPGPATPTTSSPTTKPDPPPDDNLAPLCRRHHRLKTKTPWTYRTLDIGTWLWTDPHGHTYLRNHNGTRDITDIRAA